MCNKENKTKNIKNKLLDADFNQVVENCVGEFVKSWTLSWNTDVFNVVRDYGKSHMSMGIIDLIHIAECIEPYCIIC